MKGEMTLEREFHMLGGTGESSYAANSTLQKKIASGAMLLVKEAMESVVRVIPSSETSLVFADLGCATGANTFVMLSTVINIISATCTKLGRPIPEIQLLLNDLPGNDFNTLLGPVLSSNKERIGESMRESGTSFYTAAVPGSFYERLFPQRSVHFIYSSASLHWLSQVPLGLSNSTDGPVNRRSIWISKESPPLVSKLYLEQFQRDFSSFLKYRCEELHSEGHMALIIPGRLSADPSTEESAVWISWYEEGLQDLVSKGIVKAADVDSFNIPLYFPSMEEVKSIIHKEGSFEVIQDDVYEILYTDGLDVIPADTDHKIWEKIINISRAVLEPLLLSHFGHSIVEPLFSSTLPKVYAKQFFKEKYKSANLAISIKKK